MKVTHLSTISRNKTSTDFQNFKTSDKKKVWVEAFGCSANIADAEISKVYFTTTDMT